MHRKSSHKYEEKAVWLQMLFLPFQQGGMGFEQVQILHGVDTGKKISKVIPDQTRLQLVKNVSNASSNLTHRSPEKDRSLLELDSTLMGSPSPVKTKQDRKTRFTFKKSANQIAIDPVVDGSVSNIGSPSLNATARMDGSITDRALLPSDTRQNSPLLKVRPSDDSAVSKIELGDDTSGLLGHIPLINSAFVPTQNDVSPFRAGAESPEQPDSPAERLQTPDKDKSFLERARLRRRNHTFKKFEESETVFALSDDVVAENLDANKSEPPNADEQPMLKLSSPKIRRKKIASRIESDEN
jgi:hypothetical protein